MYIRPYIHPSLYLFDYVSVNAVRSFDLLLAAPPQDSSSLSVPDPASSRCFFSSYGVEQVKEKKKEKKIS
tara:strand:- start:755 stop:964 length:210 start_codon:yes stop_codon:yes gene_type:complete